MISEKYSCHNILSFLRIKTLSNFYADRELERPLDLLHRRSNEGKNSCGVFTAVYALGQTLEKMEKNLCKIPKGHQRILRNSTTE